MIKICKVGIIKIFLNVNEKVIYFSIISRKYRVINKLLSYHYEKNRITLSYISIYNIIKMKRFCTFNIYEKKYYWYRYQRK